MSATVVKLNRDATPEFQAPPPRWSPAHVIQDDAEAIAAAHEVAVKIAKDAVLRYRQRVLPFDELEWISNAGLLAITVPKEFGGAGGRAGTLAEIIPILAAADGSI